jgi:hypothetical protein
MILQRNGAGLLSKLCHLEEGWGGVGVHRLEGRMQETRLNTRGIAGIPALFFFLILLSVD